MRPAVLGVLLLSALASLPAAGPHSGPMGPPPPAREGAATVEPIPPLLVDLRAELQDLPAGGRARGRIVIELEAGPDLDGLVVAFQAPREVDVDVSSLPLPAAPFRLEAGRRRVITLPLRGVSDGRHELRVEASYLLPDGTPVRTFQGTTLRTGPDAAGGRSHAGAFEVMGTPLERWVAR
ncbi:MAG: hypothetical protein ACRD5D_01655 [Candidatus Polarisedimenticolia bacterium]